MEVRHLGALSYASLKDVIHATTRGQGRCQCLLALLDALMVTAQVKICVECVGKKMNLDVFHLCYDN